MKEFLKALLGITIWSISFSAHGQLNVDCRFLDPNILIINCGVESRNALAEVIGQLRRMKPKVIALDFIFFDRRRADSIFIKRMKCETPIIIAMGSKNDSSYFNLDNCHNGPHSITGNEVDNVEFLFPVVKHNKKLRDSFELLVLKYYDPEKYWRLKNYLNSFDLSKLDGKAKIEFNGNSLKCFNSLDIGKLENLNPDLVKDKVVLLGYFGLNSDTPSKKDRDKFAFRVPGNNGETNYMYSPLISANIISNLIRKEIRDEDLNRIKK